MKTYLEVSYTLVAIAFVGCLAGILISGGETTPPLWVSTILFAIYINLIVAIILTILYIIFQLRPPR